MYKILAKVLGGGILAISAKATSKATKNKRNLCINYSNPKSSLNGGIYEKKAK